MTKPTGEISVRVHKTMPACCRASMLKFAAGDWYQGYGEPGDRVKCGCGNTLMFRPPGWKVVAAGLVGPDAPTKADA